MRSIWTLILVLGCSTAPQEHAADSCTLIAGDYCNALASCTGTVDIEIHSRSLRDSCCEHVGCRADDTVSRDDVWECLDAIAAYGRTCDTQDDMSACAWASPWFGD